jgi:enolase-phosphatase E1
MTKLYLFDIEGTTTDISFVHKVLFPFSDANMQLYVLHHQEHPVVRASLEKVRQTILEEEQRSLDLSEVIAQLRKWIKIDRKHPALKEIQGLIWDKGYAEGKFKGHVYPDVHPYFRKIKEAGAKIGIYSSGSVHAQKLIFGYSVEGDLTPYISYYFDTKLGGKRERASYENICRETQTTPSEIRFFSDIPEELKAARAAGLRITHVVRAGTVTSEFEGIGSFGEL